MHGRLFEVILDYQRARAAIVGGFVPEFRERALADFAAAHHDRYPEFWVDPAWLSRAFQEAVATGEIVPLGVANRDDQYILRHQPPAT